MTISSTTRINGPYISGTALPVTFKVFTAADLQVIRLNTSTGTETTLVLNSDYTVTLNGDQNTNPGGTVTLVVAASATSTVTITSDIANLQPTDLTNQGGFYPEVITDSLDRATIQIQQIADIGDRTLKIPISDGTLNMELPTKTERANSFLSFDANGLPTVVTAGSSGAPATITRQVFSGTGSQTAFTLASDPGALGNSAQVYIGGVYQQRSTYTIAGTTLTFSQAPVAGTDNIEFVNFLTSSIGATSADLVTYTPSGTSAVARSAASKFGETVSVKDFGAVGDGVADDTAAIQAAINAAYTQYNRPVYFPCGIYKITGTITITQGVMLIGAGSQGSSDSFGTTIIHHSNSDCLVWNGSGTLYAGTGGGLQNFQILKATGYSGGNAIKIVSTNDTQRPGEMVLSNILVAMQSTGLWQRGLFIDGSATVTPGSAGVRSVHCFKVRVAACTENNEYIKLTTVVHFAATGLQIDQATGTGTVGMTIDGAETTNIFVTGANINGNLLIQPSTAACQCVVSGRVGSTFTINGNVIGTFTGIAGTVANSSTANFAVYNKQNVSAQNVTANDVTAVRHISLAQTGSVSKVGYIGEPSTFSLASGLTFTYTSITGKMFYLYTGGGAAALFFADYSSATISMLSNPSGLFALTSTPSASEIGVFKSLNSHIISIKNGTASSVNLGMLVLGLVTATTDPA